MENIKKIYLIKNYLKDHLDNFNCQIINIITQKKEIYRLLYSVLYICIVIIIGIFIYWDTIYKTAKKYSKCNNISKIIDENYYNNTPFIYTIIIINTMMIKKPEEYIIKITYDFNKMETNIEYANTNDEENIFKYRKNKDKYNYIEIYKQIKDLEKDRDDKKEAYLSNKKDEIKKSDYETANTNYTAKISSEEGKATLLYIKDNQPNFVNKFNYYYYNLNKMKPDIIEDISMEIDSNNYKYFAVNNKNNIIYSYTTNELIKFTKEYSKNKDYPITIIDYIIFSKLQQNNFNNI
jgi:hypothetical protein